MPNTDFSEKLYTSTEVAQILGVSLRSIYRYLDEDKIQAAVKTATGRHRFTKQNINDFLHPTEQKQVPVIEGNETTYYQETRSQTLHKSDVIAAKEEVVEKHVEPGEPVEPIEVVKVEPVDWLAKFRQAAEKYKSQEPKAQEPSASIQPPVQVWQEPKVVEVQEEVVEESEFNYYRSGVGGLKEIAQSLDKSAKNASLDYAFTMHAGLSLHKPIKPFSLIHAYVRPGDRSYFEKVLQLTPSTKDSAQLCLVISSEEKLYKDRNEMHGLQVVSDAQLKLDLLNEGETDLANELE
jgi:predicted transcriptional regulator